MKAGPSAEGALCAILTPLAWAMNPGLVGFGPSTCTTECSRRSAGVAASGYNMRGTERIAPSILAIRKNAR
jgi:hypothetical protein